MISLNNGASPDRRPRVSGLALRFASAISVTYSSFARSSEPCYGWLSQQCEPLRDARHSGRLMVLNGQDESRKAWQQGLSPMQEIGGTERGIQACAAVLSRLFGAVSTLESIAPGRGTSSYSEGEDWKTLESKWANYYRKQKPPEELGSFVEAIMKLEKEWISHLPPERQKHAIGISIELTGVLSERK